MKTPGGTQKNDKSLREMDGADSFKYEMDCSILKWCKKSWLFIKCMSILQRWTQLSVVVCNVLVMISINDEYLQMK